MERNWKTRANTFSHITQTIMYFVWLTHNKRCLNCNGLLILRANEEKNFHAVYCLRWGSFFALFLSLFLDIICASRLADSNDLEETFSIYLPFFSLNSVCRYIVTKFPFRHNVYTEFNEKNGFPDSPKQFWLKKCTLS